jgi:hypothetical protein
MAIVDRIEGAAQQADPARAWFGCTGRGRWLRSHAGLPDINSGRTQNPFLKKIKANRGRPENQYKAWLRVCRLSVASYSAN